jgi:membrane protein implicated in regulation of membrane protease activity
MHLDLLDPNNLVFLLPFGVGVLMILTTAFAGARPGGHSHAHAHGGGHGHAHGGPAHGHAHVGHASTHGHGHGHGARPPVSGSGKPARVSGSGLLVSFLGLNQAPLPVLLSTFLLGWGFCGFWAGQLFHSALPLSLTAAALGGFLIARVAAGLTSRLMPPDTTSAVSRPQLLGLTGHAACPIDESVGRVLVYDAFGTLHDESCRLEKGELPIEKGSQVLLIDYDDRRRLFLVERVG